jgi:glycine/D-amino acid oxidase-like deaminating enzyme
MATTKGQTIVVRTKAILQEFILDMSEPDTDLCYILPRDDGEVILGGTHAPTAIPDVDPIEARRIERRSLELVPELAGSFSTARHWCPNPPLPPFNVCPEILIIF